MKKFIGIILVVIATSCSTEEVLTPGEIAGRELQTQAEKFRTREVWVYERSTSSSWVLIDSGEFRISGQFLIIRDSYYNLDRLQRFEFSVDSDFVQVYLM